MLYVLSLALLALSSSNIAITASNAAKPRTYGSTNPRWARWLVARIGVPFNGQFGGRAIVLRLPDQPDDHAIGRDVHHRLHLFDAERDRRRVGGRHRLVDGVDDVAVQDGRIRTDWHVRG